MHINNERLYLSIPFFSYVCLPILMRLTEVEPPECGRSILVVEWARHSRRNVFFFLTAIDVDVMAELASSRQTDTHTRETDTDTRDRHERQGGRDWAHGV